MKYIFFIKKISDFDHLLPIAVNLLNKGINNQEIKLIEVYPNITTLDICKDFRYQFLRENNISLKKVFFSKEFINLIILINYFKNKIKFTKYFLIPLLKIIKVIFFYICKIRLFIIIHTHEVKKIITDHSVSDLDLYIISIAKKKKN